MLISSHKSADYSLICTYIITNSPIICKRIANNRFGNSLKLSKMSTTPLCLSDASQIQSIYTIFKPFLEKRCSIMKKKLWFWRLFSRRVLVILALIIQACFLYYIVSSGSQFSRWFSSTLTLLSLIAVLYIVSRKDKGAFKTTWVFLILSFPLFGGLLYFLFLLQTNSKITKQRIQAARSKSAPLYLIDSNDYQLATEHIGAAASQISYLQNYAGFPIYSDSSAKYLSPGEEVFDALLQALEQAETYIFLEFFIVEEGIMWNSILELLKKKAAQGVKVRVMYDDIGCFLLLPKDYPKQLEAFGIECVKFNPFRSFLTVRQNNRDHRKIVVIDGVTAFTGGFNLADEYINAKEKFGHWKDSGVQINGKAAWSFTLMFLEMWQIASGCDEDFSQYLPDFTNDTKNEGFVQPYADSPMDHENVGEHVYLQILNHAQDYVYICTPYLIVDDSMLSALCLAAKSGIDVRIITPQRWDKWPIHVTTRSYYRDLLKAGVKVYEYSGGFMHAKTFVSDDHTATVGTVNLDFRSMYLHYECGALIFNSQTIGELKEDFLKTMEICHPITEQDCHPNLLLRLFQDILRLFAPIM